MESIDYLRFAAALVFVVGLVLLAAWALRRFGFAGTAVARSGGRERRLGIVEAFALDARRRLVLVRRDDVEHLLLVSATETLVVERGIPAAPAARPTPPAGDGP